DVRCDGGIPRMAAQPVLGIEIIARRRWQDGRRWSWNSLLGPPWSGGVQLAWRDFTSAEISTGSAAFDFEVPAELALEGGQDIVVALRILHLGNTALLITTVHILQAPAAHPTSGPPASVQL